MDEVSDAKVFKVWPVYVEADVPVLRVGDCLAAPCEVFS